MNHLCFCWVWVFALAACQGQPSSAERARLSVSHAGIHPGPEITQKEDAALATVLDSMLEKASVYPRKTQFVVDASPAVLGWLRARYDPHLLVTSAECKKNACLQPKTYTTLVQYEVRLGAGRRRASVSISQNDGASSLSYLVDVKRTWQGTWKVVDVSHLLIGCGSAK